MTAATKTYYVSPCVSTPQTTTPPSCTNPITTPASFQPSTSCLHTSTGFFCFFVFFFLLQDRRRTSACVRPSVRKPFRNLTSSNSDQNKTKNRGASQSISTSHFISLFFFLPYYFLNCTAPFFFSGR